MRLYCIENGIKFLNMINYLFNRDFHSIMQIEYVNSFLQLVAEMVACRHYNTNADIVAPILIELFNGLLCFLQHHCKTDSLHLINYATNYLLCKCDIGLEMMVRINLLIWCLCRHWQYWLHIH